MKSKLSLLALAFLTACGGGGGSSAPSTPSAPAPSVQITLSAPKTFIGDTVKISWTSSNATTCTGVDGFAGIQPISGTINFTPTVGGQFKYSLRCSGAGGSSDGVQTVMVPIPPQRTSYLNFKNINMAPQKMPISSTYVQHEAITAGHAYGDFFQDGTISMVAATNVFSGKANVASLVPGRIYFFHSDGNGGWIDQTDKILSASDRTGCISPRKVVVADFNGDKKPDAFISCHGVDADPATGYYGQMGEKPRYLLSQADGSYKNKQLDLNCYCHGAAAADFNNDGFADVVLASPPVLERVAYLKNNKDGTFTEVQGKVPTSTIKKAIWGVEFVDLDNDNKFDLTLYGSENNNGPSSTPGSHPWDFAPTIFLNDGSNTFTDLNNKVVFPLTYHGDVLDVIVKDSKIAFLRAPINLTSNMQVQIFSYPSLTQSSMTQVPNADTVWFNLFNGKIVGSFANNPYNVTF